MLILASSSPRRKELLSLLGYEFKVVKSNFDEDSINEIDPSELVKKLSYHKAFSVQKDYPNDVIIAADTTVYVNNQILNKPKDEEDAFRMLKYLSDVKKHYVATGVCIISGNKIHNFIEKTTVYFHNNTDQEILDYINTKEPLDKAGAYGIQGRGSVLVKKINGDFFNVMGFPISKINRLLKKIHKM